MAYMTSFGDDEISRESPSLISPSFNQFIRYSKDYKITEKMCFSTEKEKILVGCCCCPVAYFCCCFILDITTRVFRAEHIAQSRFMVARFEAFL
jgi:hypothetical protein